jgi:hemerythrin-like domain-containing protein
VIRHRAIAAIQEEHRSIAAVIRGLSWLATEAAAGRGGAPDAALLRAMLCYVREYPERLHHPAEDRTLFASVRRRTHEGDRVIAELEEEHARGEEHLEELEDALSSVEGFAPGAIQAFAAAVRAYADFHWAHVRKEEEVVLPLAERALADEDWRAIHGAFAGHEGPAFDADDTTDAFRRLFSRIVALAPPPIGVGPPR